jgi:hypothetical protein
MMHNQVPFIVLPSAAREAWFTSEGDERDGLSSLLSYRFEFPVARAALTVECNTEGLPSSEWVQVNVAFIDQLQATLRMAGGDVPERWLESLDGTWCSGSNGAGAHFAIRAIATPSVAAALRWSSGSDVDYAVLEPIQPVIKQMWNWVSGLLGRNLIWAVGEIGEAVPPGVVLMGHDTIRLIGAEETPIVMIAGLVRTTSWSSLTTRFCNALAIPDTNLASKSAAEVETGRDSTGKGFAQVIVDPMTASYLQLDSSGRKLLLLRRNIWRSWWQEGPSMMTLLIGPLGLAATFLTINGQLTWLAAAAMLSWSILIAALWVARVRRKGGAFRR